MSNVNFIHLSKLRYMTLLIVYGVLSICFSFLCSILEAVLLSVTPTFVSVKINGGKAYAKLAQFWLGFRQKRRSGQEIMPLVLFRPL